MNLNIFVNKIVKTQYFLVKAGKNNFFWKLNTNEVEKNKLILFCK